MYQSDIKANVSREIDRAEGRPEDVVEYGTVNDMIRCEEEREEGYIRSDTHNAERTSCA